jgi:Domain of unknown function (DUF4190)
LKTTIAKTNTANMLKLLFSTIISLCFSLQSGAIGTPAISDPEKNSNALVKRMVANLSPKDFTAVTGKKLNFLTKMAYKKMRRQFRKELSAAGLQNDFDTLYLADGGIVTGIILANTPTSIKYKATSDEESELKEITPALVKRISMAKSLSAVRDDEDAPIEKTATGAMWLGIFSFVGLFIPYFNILTVFSAIAALTLGITSLNKIKKSKGKLRGEGRAITGIVLGSVFILLLLALIAALANSGWGWG